MQNASLNHWRDQIDKLDNELLSLLAKRMEIVQKIGRIKQSSHASILDKKRWQQVLEGIDAKAKKLKLPKKFVHELFTRIHQQALETERKDL